MPTQLRSGRTLTSCQLSPSTLWCLSPTQWPLPLREGQHRGERVVRHPKRQVKGQGEPCGLGPSSLPHPGASGQER